MKFEEMESDRRYLTIQSLAKRNCYVTLIYPLVLMQFMEVSVTATREVSDCRQLCFPQQTNSTCFLNHLAKIHNVNNTGSCHVLAFSLSSAII